MKLCGILLMLICVNTFAENSSAKQQALQAKFDRCARGPASQDDLNNLLTMDSAARDIFVSQMREFVNTEMDDNQKGLICMTANMPEYSNFTQTVDYVKSQISDNEFKNLTYSEIAFYTNCDKSLNPFYKNMKPGEIQYTNEGLTETTIEMINSMGPLLLEKGPDGRTALEYVQAMLDYASSSGSDTVSGVYSRIKSRIEIEIMELDQQVAQL